MPITDRSCCVLSPQSLVSGPVAGQAAKGMRFCVRALHALVACSFGGRRDSGFDRWRFPAVRLAVALVCGDFGTSAIPPVFSLLSLGHSLGACPAPGGASMFCFVRHGERPSGLGFQQQISRAENKNTLEISCRSLRRKHISALGAGHLTSLRARVSRGSSGQKPTWRKSSWHSTKTPSA